MNPKTGFLHIDSFRHRYGISLAKLNELEKRGIVRIVQTGYVGHSLAHPRAVVFNPVEIGRILGSSEKLRLLTTRDKPPLITKGYWSTLADKEALRLYNEHKFRNWRLYR